MIFVGINLIFSNLFLNIKLTLSVFIWIIILIKSILLFILYKLVTLIIIIRESPKIFVLISIKIICLLILLKGAETKTVGNYLKISFKINIFENIFDFFMSCEVEAERHVSDKVVVMGLHNLDNLDNLGNTCYMNCTLQALYAIEDFRKYMLSSDWPPKPLHSSTAKVLSEMSSKDSQKSVDPKQFWHIFTEYKPRFQGRDQQDEQECLRYLIDGSN